MESSDDVANELFRAVLDDTDNAVHLGIPLVESVNENLQVVHRQIARHYPIDLHCLVDLINGATDQVKRHGFHHEHLDLVGLNDAALSNLVKCEAPLIFTAVKEHLKEGQNTHFLLKVGHLSGDGRETRDKVVVTLDGLSKLSDLTATKRHKHVVEPLEVATN